MQSKTVIQSLLLPFVILGWLLSLSVQSQNPVSVSSTGGTPLASYPTLKDAFDAINAGTHQNSIIVEITDHVTETSSAVLNESGSGLSNYTDILIRPSGGTNRTIEGNINDALITLNGADQVTIDGLNSGGNTLILRNTSALSSASTVTWIGGASNNLLTRCTIEGSTTGSTTGSLDRGILFFSTGGNSNNTVSLCSLSAAGSNRPRNVVFSFGTSGQENLNNTLQDNHIYNFLSLAAPSFGIHLDAHTSQWTLTGNSFFETTTFSPTAAVEYRIIDITNNSGNQFTVTNNFIGGSQASCGGTAWNKTGQNNTFYGLYLAVGNTTASEIHGNTIQNISWSNLGGSSWYAMWIHAGLVNLGTNQGNVIGSTAGTGSIVFTSSNSGVGWYGIFLNNNAVVDCRNNTIGSITVSASAGTNATNFWGIHKTGAGNTTISQNTIGHAGTPQSIQITSTSTSNAQTMFGIQSLGTGNVTISNNTIAHLFNGTTNSNTSTLGYVHGIQVSAGTNIIRNNTIQNLSIGNANTNGLNTASVVGISFNFTTAATQEISGNTLFNLSNTRSDFSGSIIGIYYNGSTTASQVSENHIFGLSVDAATTVASVYGIRANGGFTTYANNLIRLGGNTQTLLYGLFDNGASGSTQLYFNTIYLSGAPTNGNPSSFALYSNGFGNVRNFRNNILVNARTNNGASGNHYALWLNYGVSSNLTLEYNTYFSNGTGGILARYNAADVNNLPIVPDRDWTSFQIDPNFTNPSGNTVTDFLPQANQLSGLAIAGITTDILGNSRGQRVSLGALQYQTLGRIQVQSTGGSVTDTTYTLLKEAFDALNAGIQTGSIVIKINANTIDNTLPAVLNESGSGGANYTDVVIYPTTANTLLKGSIDAGSLIQLSGADRVVIDGRVNRTGSTIDLELENSSLTSAYILHYLNDSQQDTLRFCRLKGQSTAMVLMGQGSAIGNTDIVIEDNFFTRVTGGIGPTHCVESNTGGTGPLNRDLFIRRNEFANYFRNGSGTGSAINLLNCTHVTIDANSFFHDIIINVSAGPITWNTIRINSSTGHGFNLTNNFIGGSLPQCQGTYFEGGNTTGLNPGFNGMLLNVSNLVGEESYIDGNTIANILWRNTQITTGQPWAGIRASGNVIIGGQAPNLIGSQTVNNSIYLVASGGGAHGIAVGGRAEVKNNIVAGVVLETTSVEFVGILAEGDNVIEGNTIGSSLAQSISHTANGGILTGIKLLGAITAVAKNNTVQRLAITNSTANSGVVRGVLAQKASTGTNSNFTVRGNTIRELSTLQTGSAARIRGIEADDNGFTGAFVLAIDSNTISQLQTVNNNPNTNVNAGLIGIYVRNTSISSIAVNDNQVSQLINTSTAYSGHMAGVVMNSTSTNTQVQRNFVHQLSLASNNTSAVAYGLYIHTGIPQVVNNIIAIGENSPVEYIGIGDYSATSSGTRSFYFNTVRIGGSPTTGDRPSAAFWSNSATGNKDYQNNLLVNNRTNAGSATGKHYGLVLNYATVNNLTLEFNNYFANGSGGVLGLFNSLDVNTLPLLSESDYTSFDVNPLFANPTGTNAVDFLPSEPLLCGNAISGITSDYGGNPRNTLHAIGAWQYNVVGRVDVDTVTGTLLGTYANLREALDAINNGIHQGNLQVRIKYNTFENSTASIQRSGAGSANYSRILMTPSGGRNVAIIGRFNLPLLLLDGASQVKIDGLNSGGNALRFIQFSTGSTAPTIGWINGASQDTLTRCTILGATSASGTDQNGRGVLWFGTSSGSTGNNQNVVSFNQISQAGSTTTTRPVNALYSFGSAGLANTGNKIEGNEFYNFFRPTSSSFGIHLLSHSTQWIILNNSFYESTTLSPNTTAQYRAINIENTSGDGFQITGNYIGGSAVQCGGTPFIKTNSTNANNIFYGIYLACGSPASEVQGNIIRNIQWTNTASAAMYGIWIHTGTVNVGTQSGNIVGDTTGNAQIQYICGSSGGGFYGLYFAANAVVNAQQNVINAITVNTLNSQHAANFWGIFKTGAGTTTIQNNRIGHASNTHSIEAISLSTSNAQTLYGIRSEGNGSIQITGNQIGHLTNRTTNTSTSTLGLVQGIYVGGGTHVVTQNRIHHLENANLNTNGLQNASVAGICFFNAASAAQQVSENQIYQLSNVNPAFNGTITGLFYHGGTTLSQVTRNLIYDLSVDANSTNANLYGLRINAGQTNFVNNIIYLNPSTATTVFGLFENGLSGNHNNIYFNTITIDGQPTVGSNASYALWSNASTNTRNFRNNILVNQRSNTGSASGTHYAIYFNYAVNTNLTLDFNNYWVSGQGGVLGFYNAANVTALPMVPSRDASSVSTAPNFSNASPVSAANFYPKVQLTGTDLAGFGIDYNGSIRTSPPSLGALEAFVWTGATNDNFNVSTNWAGGVVPVENAMVRFAAAPAQPCLLDQNRRLSSIINQQATHGFHLNGFRLIITDTLALSNGAYITANTTGSQLYIQSSKNQNLDANQFSGQEVYQLRLDCSGGTTLSGALTILDQLTLDQGVVTLSAGDLTIGGLVGTPDSATYIRTTGAGALKTSIANGASFTFPVGQSTYNPVTITNHTPTDTFSVKVRDNVPNNAFLNDATYVNRTWDITKQQANTAPGIDFTFHWKANEIVANQGPLTQALLNHFNGSVWQNASGTGLTTGQNGVAVALNHTGYVGTFSPFAISSDVTPLPVDLIHFSATCEAQDVAIRWITAAEINNSHFELEQSENLVHWQTIGRISGHGTKNTPTHYQHLLPKSSLSNGRFFRLNQIDEDGMHTHHAPISVMKDCPASDLPLYIFPNPSKGLFFISHAPAHSHWTLVDAMGKTLASFKADEDGQIQCDVALPNGLYFLKSETKTFKIVIAP